MYEESIPKLRTLEDAIDFRKSWHVFGFSDHLFLYLMVFNFIEEEKSRRTKDLADSLQNVFTTLNPNLEA